jgi:hypothetical protein
MIHYEGHWKGWALEIETFSGPQIATSEASITWAQNSHINDNFSRGPILINFSFLPLLKKKYNIKMNC